MKKLLLIILLIVVDLPVISYGCEESAKPYVNYPMPIERKLAAIMFTDIAGYTEQMSKDE